MIYFVMFFRTILLRDGSWRNFDELRKQEAPSEGSSGVVILAGFWFSRWCGRDFCQIELHTGTLLAGTAPRDVTWSKFPSPPPQVCRREHQPQRRHRRGYKLQHRESPFIPFCTFLAVKPLRFYLNHECCLWPRLHEIYQRVAMNYHNRTLARCRIHNSNGKSSFCHIIFFTSSSV